ncbi:YaiI/YqxD family protein [Geopsychrobacter electrodiphilus]|uniref:YaiI/YqxD family protein n=1 Tax=Geopsychrobacter electrodiphilus TaxID=225196 RepID=UPI000364A46B|nr:YaiI/YqxD family protein [Geopsychrobacter electrodiphilus]
MKIWIDGDACPRVIKEVLYRAADKRQMELVLVANKPIAVPRSCYIRTVQVGAGADVADAEIVRLLDAGDLVVTADIPLASLVIEKGGTALDPRGEIYTPENIGARLSMRNFMEELRNNGVETGGPASFSSADRQSFANQLDRILTRALSA